MTAVRTGLGLLLALAVYFAVAMEAVIGGRTLMPHAPAVVLIVATWFLPTTPAVVMAAAIGLGCDAVGTGLLGPGVIAAVTAAVIGSTLRHRWQLESLLAVILFGMGVGLTLIAGPIVAGSLLPTGGEEIPGLQIEVARATSSAMAALGITLLARLGASTKRLTTAAWNA
ncbi:MAG TPA: hypothetical protein VM452_15585 [Caulifigura sp.]|jgi:hypothetical protein|nr:hypothetical protein [Caulifigura sp.]